MSESKAMRAETKAKVWGFAILGLLILVVTTIWAACYWVGSVDEYQTVIDNGDGSTEYLNHRMTTYAAAEDWMERAIGCEYDGKGLIRHAKVVSGTVERAFNKVRGFSDKSGSWTRSTLFITLDGVPGKIFVAHEAPYCTDPWNGHTGPKLGAPTYGYGLTNPGDHVTIYYFDGGDGREQNTAGSVLYLILGFDNGTANVDGYAPPYVRQIIHGDISMPLAGQKDTTPYLPAKVTTVNFRD